MPDSEAPAPASPAAPAVASPVAPVAPAPAAAPTPVSPTAATAAATAAALAATAPAAVADPKPAEPPSAPLEIVHNNSGVEITRYVGGNRYILVHGENLIQDLVDKDGKVLLSAKAIADHLWEQGWNAGQHMSPGVSRESRSAK
jgi:hypothetical protein